MEGRRASTRAGLHDARVRARSGVRLLLLHERAQIAGKAAVAATLAWVVAEAVSPAELQDYQYYAPLGAVVATYPTVLASVRSAVQAVASIAVGGAVGLAAHALASPGLPGLALAVAGGVAAGSLPALGSSRSWVPVVALFVLVIGGSEPWTYALAYLVLAVLGAVLAIVVSLAMPALRLGQGRDAVTSAQAVLADQLEDLAGGLRQSPRPGPVDWARRQRRIEPVVLRMRTGVSEAIEARRANPRARFHRAEAERQRATARAVERVALLVEDVTAMLVETHRGDLPSSPLDDDLAREVADALDRLATLVRVVDSPLPPDDDRVVEVRGSLLSLTEAFGRRRDLAAADVAVVGAVVANLRGCLAAVAPDSLAPSG